MKLKQYIICDSKGNPTWNLRGGIADTRSEAEDTGRRYLRMFKQVGKIQKVVPADALMELFTHTAEIKVMVNAVEPVKVQ